jgi:hypothetical protein
VGLASAPIDRWSLGVGGWIIARWALIQAVVLCDRWSMGFGSFLAYLVYWFLLFGSIELVDVQWEQSERQLVVMAPLKWERR